MSVQFSDVALYVRAFKDDAWPAAVYFFSLICFLVLARHSAVCKQRTYSLTAAPDAFYSVLACCAFLLRFKRRFKILEKVKFSERNNPLAPFHLALVSAT